MIKKSAILGYHLYLVSKTEIKESFLREKFFRSGLLADVDDYDLESTKKMEKI